MERLLQFSRKGGKIGSSKQSGLPQGVTYMAFFPAVEEGADEDSDDYGMVILKSITENGEDFLSTLDSDEELDEVYALFMERLFEDEEEGGDGE